MFSTKFDQENKVWSGQNVVPTYNPKVSVAQVLLAALSTYGSKIAQVHALINYRKKNKSENKYKQAVSFSFSK